MVSGAHPRAAERVVDQAQRQIGEYQSRVEAAPVVEQELASLQRDYDSEKGATRSSDQATDNARDGRGTGAEAGR